MRTYYEAQIVFELSTMGVSNRASLYRVAKEHHWMPGTMNWHSDDPTPNPAERSVGVLVRKFLRNEDIQDATENMILAMMTVGISVTQYVVRTVTINSNIDDPYGLFNHNYIG